MQSFVNYLKSPKKEMKKNHYLREKTRAIKKPVINFCRHRKSKMRTGIRPVID